MTILPSSSAWTIRSVEMFRIRALVWKLSVTIPIWAPVKLIAGTPSAWIAIAISATLTCSPVDRSMSISRAGGRSVISLASSISSSVVCPRAETTTSTCSPALVRPDRAAGRGQDLVGIGDARAAELLDQERHVPNSALSRRSDTEALDPASLQRRPDRGHRVEAVVVSQRGSRTHSQAKVGILPTP